MRLTNARVPGPLLESPDEPLKLVDIVLDGDRIALVEPASGGAPADGNVDCDGGIVLPAFVDMHTHLDKGHIAPRAPNPDGTFASALATVGDDSAAHWTAADVAARMEFALRCAYAHGTASMRTHIDSQEGQLEISWPVFADMKSRWAERITLQGASLTGIDRLPADIPRLFDVVTAHGGMVGAVLYPVPQLREGVRALMEEAEARGLDIDFHVDEALNPQSNCLSVVAEEADRIGFSGTVTCGHCCSLMVMDESEADRTLDAVAAAGLCVVSLPLCNLYLMDRDAGAQRTPRIRGGTLVHEMAARGIKVAFASDNTRDPFYAFGDLDMLEVWRVAKRVMHLDHPVGDWPRTVNAAPAAIMGLPDRDAVAPGAPADLILTRARDYSELFSRPHADRTVIRHGQKVDAAPPDYRELDPL
ncbi:MAG: cytosine deaminase, partial [Pseudomonadota bacterium]